MPSTTTPSHDHASATGHGPAAIARKRWLTLALLFICRTSFGLQFQTIGSVSDALVGQFGFSYTEIGSLIGAFLLPGLVLALPAGFAGRWWSDRHIVAAGLLVMAAGGAVSALAQGFGMLGLGRLVAGVGFVVSTLYFTKMIADWFAGHALATAMGVLVMSWPFGIAAGQMGHAWIAVHWAWQWAFVVASAWCALAALAVFWLYRSPPAVAKAATASAPAPAVGLPRREWLLTSIAATVWGAFNAGYLVYLSFAPRVLMAQGYGLVEAAALVSVANWVMIFSAAVCGQIADRTGRRDLVLYLCLAVAVAVMLALPSPMFAGHALGINLLFGLLGAAPAGVIMALTGDAMAPQRRAFGMGVFFSLYFVLVAMAPPTAGWLYDRSGSPEQAMWFAAALFASAGVVNAVFRAVQRRVT